MKGEAIFEVVRSMGWKVNVEEMGDEFSNLVASANTEKRSITVNSAAALDDQIYSVYAYALCGLTSEKKPIWFKGDCANESKCCRILTGWDYSRIEGFVTGVYKTLAMVESWTKARVQ